jgi:GT2 family glycosyltransferase
MYDISIVIVNYNVKDFLFKCLESIEKAKGNLKVETLVVDNDSSDGSVEYLRPLFPDVTFVETGANLGFGKANNIGFEMSKGKYILILNPDTVIEEKNLKTVFDYMEANPDVGITGCKVLNPDGTFQLPCRRGFPTPWASFCKLFGLQGMFPKSKLFAQYNQTYLSTDETYEIDAIMGAYMFARKDVIDELEGFDRDFFMYGEDIDLCFRNKQLGYKTMYLHTTSIIHYKGESTRRSSINDVKHFYDAMVIFAKKHNSRSKGFLVFIKLGIFLRAILAYVLRFKEDVGFMIADLAVVNSALIISTYIKTGEFFPFPEYAYPTIFIVMSIVIVLSMIFSGEYFEEKHSVRKSVFGVLIMFFITSSLTYFFKQFAFSRGIVLMTTGISGLGIPTIRLIAAALKKKFGSEKDKSIIIVGLNENSAEIARSLEKPEHANINVSGFVSIKESYPTDFENYPVLGNIYFLDEVIKKSGAKEIVVSEPEITNNKLMEIVSKFSETGVKYHIATEYDQLMFSEILEDIAGRKSPHVSYPISSLRNILAKRSIDIILPLLALSIFLPITVIAGKKGIIKKLWHTLLGKKSLIGYYTENIDDLKYPFGKEGITGLAHISHPERLSKDSINKLNEFYLTNYSVSLDFDIFIKSIYRSNKK